MNLTKELAVAALLLSAWAVPNANAGSRAFVLISKALGNPFFAEVEKGAQEEANKLGCSVVYLGPAEADQTAQIQGYANALVGQRPAEMGAKSIDVLMAICDQKEIQTVNDTGVDLVTAENVDRFIDR